MSSAAAAVPPGVPAAVPVAPKPPVLVFSADDTKLLQNVKKAYWIGIAMIVVGLSVAVFGGIICGALKLNVPQLLLKDSVWISCVAVGGAFAAIGALVLISARNRQAAIIQHACNHPDELP